MMGTIHDMPAAKGNGERGKRRPGSGPGHFVAACATKQSSMATECFGSVAGYPAGQQAPGHTHGQGA